MPLLRRAARADGRRPRHVPALRELPARRSDPADGAVLPAARLRAASSATSSSSRPSSRRTRSSPSTRTSPRTRRSWVEHAREYVEMIRARLRSDRTTSSSSSPRTTATCSSTSSARASRSSASTRRPTWRRRPKSAACPRSSRSSAARRRSSSLREGKRASLVIGNNVLAQVPDLNDFVGGREEILSRDDGTATFEFPHLLRLLDGLQYDTIYHEHFSYFSFATIARDPARARARRLRRRGALDARRLAARLRPASRTARTRYRAAVADAARARGGRGPSLAGALRPLRGRRQGVEARAARPPHRLRRDGKHVVGYGAPGKGNTLLNYCGIRTDLLDYTVDRNPYKHGLFTPGTHIPIHPPEKIAETRPDYVVVLPWNLIDEIASSSRTSPSGAGG